MAEPSSKEEVSKPCDPISEEEIDESLEGSFPASDPPPWTLGVESHCDSEEKKRSVVDPSHKPRCSDQNS